MKKLTLAVVCSLALGTTLICSWFIARPDQSESALTNSRASVETRERETFFGIPRGEEMADSETSRATSERGTTSRPVLTASTANVQTPEISAVKSERPRPAMSARNRQLQSTGDSSLLVGGPEGVITSAIAEPVLTLVLPPGVREPAVLLDSPEELSTQQAIALDDISDEFIAQVEQAVASGSEETVTEAWETAQQEADSQFRILFGDIAYNQMQMDAAIADMARAGSIR